MGQVILDTNFIVTCIKQKIDFFEEIQLMGLKPLISEQVITELERLGYEDGIEDARLALSILEKSKFDLMDLGGGSADKGIANLAKTNRQLIVATLDKALKDSIPNQKLVIVGKKKLEIVD